METIYVVQAFIPGKRGALIAQPPISFKTESQARARAARLGETAAGVLAWSQTADVEAGEYGEPVVLERVGAIPDVP